MAAVTLVLADLAPFATIEPVKAQAMIDDVMALAAQHAPCIITAEFDDLKAKAARGILRRVVLRWNDTDSGAMQTQSAGPFAMTVDTRQHQRAMFTADEIDQLKQLCQGAELTGAYAIDTAPTTLTLVPYPDPYLYPGWYPDFAYFDGPPS